MFETLIEVGQSILFDSIFTSEYRIDVQKTYLNKLLMEFNVECLFQFIIQKNKINYEKQILENVIESLNNKLLT